ncbi:MAG: tRNA/tmRNA/rRNA uracil-C5-methylase (TrmA/RlmC/RlmD family) [Polaribacter sp.]|jgi:tRNA/tmRNA/rRNA uracil-C5-methylase (TrmA/RlmC/RlmD family)
MIAAGKINDPYFSTPDDVVLKKLELLKLQDGETLVDLGCGDARHLIYACAIAEVTCIGYEILPEGVHDAEANIKKAGLENNIEIKTENFFHADISKVDTVILYLSRYVLGEISLKLENELPKGARIVTHQFDIPAWKADKEIDFLQKNGQIEKIYLYQKK